MSEVQLNFSSLSNKPRLLADFEPIRIDQSDAVKSPRQNPNRLSGLPTRYHSPYPPKPKHAYLHIDGSHTTTPRGFSKNSSKFLHQLQNTAPCTPAEINLTEAMEIELDELCRRSAEQNGEEVTVPVPEVVNAGGQRARNNEAAPDPGVVAAGGQQARNDEAASATRSDDQPSPTRAKRPWNKKKRYIWFVLGTVVAMVAIAIFLGIHYGKGKGNNIAFNHIPTWMKHYASNLLACDHAENAMLERSALPYCSDKDSFLEAINKGQYVNDTHFKTHECRMPWPQKQDYCSILTKFTELTFVSDAPLLLASLALIPWITQINPEDGVLFCNEKKKQFTRATTALEAKEHWAKFEDNKHSYDETVTFCSQPWQVINLSINGRCHIARSCPELAH